jgi:nicotinamidase-related amidase
MRRDKTKAILSTIATLTSVALILVYWLFPAHADSHRLHILLIDCIPDIVVVLIAMPVVYWLLYRRGLTNMGDCPLFSPGSTATVVEPPSHLCRHSPPRPTEQTGTQVLDTDEISGRRDVLLVMDAPDDLMAGSRDLERTAQAVDAAIRAAESRAMPVVFARFQHPSQGQGPSETQRVLSVGGGEPSRETYTPAGATVVELEERPGLGGGSVLDNPVLDLIVSHPKVRSVYVVGGVLEHSVRPTCRDILQRGKEPIALQTTILSASHDPAETEKAWRESVAEGLTTVDSLTSRGTESL